MGDPEARWVPGTSWAHKVRINAQRDPLVTMGASEASWGQ